jgi:phthalate 4,5-cis-dihydrodiol dehydrogenase
MGAVQIVQGMEGAPYLELVAAADVRTRSLDAFRERFGGRAYQSVEDLCKDPDVDAIWIATPNSLHREHTVMAAQHGKHIVIEKPMAVTLEEAEQMVEAADKYGVKLLAGHTASLTASFRAMRRVITSGRLGKVRAINNWAFTDYLFRPRMPQELVTELGGGAPFVMGPHSIDVVRLMGGGMVRSVRGTTGDWMSFRKGIGYFCAYLEFEDGTPAMVMHNGNGYTYNVHFYPWVGDSIFRDNARQLRKGLRNGEEMDDAPEKEEMRFGSSNEGAMYRVPEGQRRSPGMNFHSDAGIIVVSCERGDIRQSENGLIIHDDDGDHEEVVEGVGDERLAELRELYDSVRENRAAHHDGRWGMATLEVVLAIMQSGRERREIMMKHQVPAWE